MTTTMTEVSRDEAIQVLLASEDKYSDLMLVGSDGGTVPVVRCLLAARSAVLDKMLYGNFSEASDSTVKIPYPTDVLKGLVHYTYSDSVPLLENLELRAHQSFPLKVAALADAALYFELPILHQKALNVLDTVAKENETMAVLVLDSCATFPALLDSPTTQSIMLLIFKNPETLLKEEVTTSLQENTIKMILENHYISVKEIILFKILLTWSRKQSVDTEDTDYKAQAAKLSELIDCTKISPTELEKIVAPSGLVTTEHIFEAYKTQAVFAANQGFSFTLRRGPVWKTSGDFVCTGADSNGGTVLLDCPELSSGIHKWSLYIEHDVSRGLSYSGCWIGVASTKHAVNEEYLLGNQHQAGWAYDCFSGKTSYWSQICSTKAFDGLSGTAGVTLTLDLTGSGTLSASVDGSADFQLFSDMLSVFCGKAGFVPAVSVRSHTVVHFLGFE